MLQYAPSPSLPPTPPGGVTAGLDWATEDHVVSIVDIAGHVVARFTVAHTAAGLAELVRRLEAAGAGEIAIERSDGPVIDTLLDRADWLSVKRLAAWLAAAGYCGRKDPAVLFGHLSGAARGTTGEEGIALAHTTRAFLAVLNSLVTQIKTLSDQIGEQLALHADAQIFTSLPRCGTVRAARLLAEIGDCRARFPDPDSLIGLAGVAPSTRQSGKHKTVHFRWAVNKHLRDAVCDFASDSIRAHPWAAQLYNHAIARGKDHPHAARIVARAWLYVIWHCWHDHTAYNPAKHRALQRLLNQDQQPAA